ncbi:TetR/AcrR family transcriptional regulator [Blastococcus sp. SYSU D00820]
MQIPLPHGWSPRPGRRPDEDPRVQRTRDHVLETVRRLLTEQGPAALTHSTVAAAARVSRQTLYRYWPTPEHLAAELVTRRVARPLPQEPDPASALRSYLRATRAGFEEPATRAAYAMLIAAASGDAEIAAVLTGITEDRRRVLNGMLPPEDRLDHDEYALVVGPVVHRVLIAAQPVTDELVERVVAAWERRPPRA